jgi:hypothetical protein
VVLSKWQARCQHVSPLPYYSSILLHLPKPVREDSSVMMSDMWLLLDILFVIVSNLASFIPCSCLCPCAWPCPCPCLWSFSLSLSFSCPSSVLLPLSFYSFSSSFASFSPCFPHYIVKSMLCGSKPTTMGQPLLQHMYSVGNHCIHYHKHMYGNVCFITLIHSTFAVFWVGGMVHTHHIVHFAVCGSTTLEPLFTRPCFLQALGWIMCVSWREHLPGMQLGPAFLQGPPPNTWSSSRRSS